VLIGLRLYEDAVGALQQATRINPGDVSIYLALGSAFFNIAHYEEAGAAYRQATQLDPIHLRAYAYQRMVLIEKGNPRFI
jgi:cytochrome c-type biogenesis protein CcmH/NrfG